MSRVAALPLAPVLYPQAKALRRKTPILPDADGGPTGAVDGPDPIRLLVVGDSTAVGVGSVARALHSRVGRGVHWTVVGESGATSRDLLERYLDDATADEHDVVFVTVGANDALKLRSRGAYARDLRRLLRELRTANPDAAFIVSCFPAFGRFASIPQPLRSSLYLHSRSLEDAGHEVVGTIPGMVMSPTPPPYSDGFFGADSFHPGPQGYREWAEWAIDDALEQGIRL
jgi:lysophospholipase L1-like esterase